MMMRICWCGNSDLQSFGPEYGECRSCGTLVYLKDMPPEKLLVRDDESDYYGKKYWLEHQRDDFGNADIHARARNDLSERNLHWLRTLLKYRLPRAHVLELGCSHGSFVALLRMAGYDASGVEMSPWVVEFGRDTFDVPVAVGPVEDLDITPGSLDVIVLMDVLEHLSDPVATMAHCLTLLKPDGLLVLQTPQFKAGVGYEMLVERKDRFLEMLIPEEHIYLFSDHSVSTFFAQLGADYIRFEPAIFSHYDMFFVVSRAPLNVNTAEQVESSLLANPNGRLALAMLDLREDVVGLTLQVQESESDRAARWLQIQALTAMVKESEAALKESEAVLTETKGNLNALFARRWFSCLVRCLGWPEVKKLAKRIGR